MAMVKCKECGNDVSDKAKTCVQCGAPLPPRPGKYKTTYWVLGGCASIIGFFLISGALMPEYEHEAWARYDACEAFVKQGIAPLGTDCRSLRQRAVAEGKRLAEERRK